MAAQDIGTQTNESSDLVQLHDPPPPLVARGNAVVSVQGVSITVGGMHRSWGRTLETLERPCVRSTITEKRTQGIETEIHMTTYGVSGSANMSHSSEVTKTIKANQGFPDQDYVVVGIWNVVQKIPKEVIVPIGTPPGRSSSGQLFLQIKKAERKLRPWPRRLLSLKKITGFGIYQCVPQLGYHVMLPIDGHSQRILADLFREYNSKVDDTDDRWLRWLKEEFNSNSTDPEAGRYALRLVFRWSAPKIIFWTTSPVVLSLAIAFWYSYNPRAPDADDVAIVQTAWTIASYIITAAALMIAGLGAVTQLGD